jgi:uncharacterized membrane protein YraQ (UPF0718 family)
MIKRLLPVFQLTVVEQRVVIVLLCAVVIGVAVKSYREAALDAKSAEPLVTVDQPSSSPGIRP